MRNLIQYVYTVLAPRLIILQLKVLDQLLGRKELAWMGEHTTSSPWMDCEGQWEGLGGDVKSVLDH